MKKNKPYFKYATLTFLFLVVLIVPTIYFLGVLKQDDELRFSHYTYYVGENTPINNESSLDSFDSVAFGGIDFGAISKNLFVKLDLNDFTWLNSDSLYILELTNPGFREVEMFRFDKDGDLVSKEIAGTMAGNSNPLKNPNPFFNIGIDEELNPSVVLRIASQVPLKFEAYIFPYSSYFQNYSFRLILISVYFGIMIALFIYNLILYFSVKDKVYLFYCFYILFIALAQLSISGHSFFILNENAFLYEVSIIGFTTLSSIFVIPFIQLFLKTDEYVPKYEKYLYLIPIFYIIALLLRLFGVIEVSYSIMDLNGLILAICFFTIGIIAAKDGFRSAYFFLLAWSFLLIGLVVYILHNLMIINLGSFANAPLLAGTAIEALLLSFALADKINILKKEKEKEQIDKLEAVKENERLIKEQNIYLEKMVKSRTEELELTLKNLQNTQTQLVNQEKMASLGQLTAGIAHEINNPINFVSSNISPLKRDMKDILELMDVYREKGKLEFSEESKEEIEELEEDIEFDYLLEEVEQLLTGMEDGAKRTVEIVRGLKLFSRVDEQDVKEVDLREGLDSTLILLNSTISGRIKVNKFYEEIPMVECLAGKINQVFMNIISNAIHALLDHPIEGREPELTISTSFKDGFVIIEIKDNGIGMPESVKEKIFDPFFTTKAVGKGTGLGLSIVYTIILENHKGTLEVESEENVGTVFYIGLPVNQKG
ncbi:7TM diverse intracellular signaling domain-containing protein [Cyclobacterium sp. 1_MG-2023]|uniref:7TM diverse intracellular signaling domain-containing protein n=1 Tax=Cyclobacterium sp. 1_MG-2023 TaxID=3062681 RepID=UPI0026E1516A|nr:7TM diverse intracellular signaling domain-containing protein [Cyclobacterium sp. 1_MG-2023]MDO6437520.1 7TM diverse intracellular signaling domain-containing protein [Cyclobacterium sp. 1_MG-2023]